MNRNNSVFRVGDMMMVVLAAALAVALVKRHSEESAMAFRLKSQPPLSVWTRLAIGHTLSSFAVVFGLSRLYLSFRDRPARLSFGTWLWCVVGFYVPLHVMASVAWALVNNTLRPLWSGRAVLGFSLSETVGRVALMTFNQACFDELAWLLVAVWAATGLLRFAGRPENVASTKPIPVETPDLSIAAFTGLTVSATVFQRIMESSGL
jgi:hypothetical protein